MQFFELIRYVTLLDFGQKGRCFKIFTRGNNNNLRIIHFPARIRKTLYKASSEFQAMLRHPVHVILVRRGCVFAADDPVPVDLGKLAKDVLVVDFAGRVRSESGCAT